MSNLQIEILRFQTQILSLIQAQKIKEYDAPWLKTGIHIYREGGRFASKKDQESDSSGEEIKKLTPSEAKSLVDKGLNKQLDQTRKIQVNNTLWLADNTLDPKQKEKILNAVDDYNKQMDEVIEALKTLSQKQDEEVKSLINLPVMEKSRDMIASKISSIFGKSAGDVAKEINKAVPEAMKKGKLASVIAFLKDKASNAIQVAKENPELVAVGALAAVAAVAGGAGAIALFSWPNLIGAGGLWTAFGAITQGAGMGGVASAFASGYAANLGFGLSTLISISGLSMFIKSLMLFGIDPKTIKEMKQFQKELEIEQKKSALSNPLTRRFAG